MSTLKDSQSPRVACLLVDATVVMVVPMGAEVLTALSPAVMMDGRNERRDRPNQQSHGRPIRSIHSNRPFKSLGVSRRYVVSITQLEIEGEVVDQAARASVGIGPSRFAADQGLRECRTGKTAVGTYSASATDRRSFTDVIWRIRVASTFGPGSRGDGLGPARFSAGQYSGCHGNIACR